MIIPDTNGQIREATTASLNGGELSDMPIRKINGSFTSTNAIKKISANINILP